MIGNMLRSAWKMVTFCIVLFLAAQPLLAAGGDPTGENDDQFGSIHGTVRTADGTPAPAVTVQLKGATKNTQTDDNGHFTLRRIAAGEYTLVVSLIGYSPSEKPVTVTAGKVTTIEVNLQVSNQQLKEVTIAGNKTNKFTRTTSDNPNKMPLKMIENPQVYTVISKELMNDQIVITQDDALKNAPGFSKMWDAVGRPGIGGSIYNSRGFYTYSNFRNGLPGTATAKVDMFNAESVEVIKGPSATLFGSSQTSYGGLINRVTKKPYDTRGGEISYTTGSYGLNRLTADVNTPLDSAKQVLFRLNAAYTSTNTWQDNGFSKNLAVAPSLTYNVNDRLSFQFDAEIYRGQQTAFPMFYFPYGSTVTYFGVNSADKLNIDYKRLYSSNDLNSISNNMNFFGQMRYKLSDNWVSTTLISTSRNSSDGAQGYFQLAPGNDSVLRNAWKPEGYDNSLDIQQNFNGDFKIGSLRNRIVAGLDYYQYNSNVIYREFIGSNGNADYFDIVSLRGNDPNYGNFNKAKVDAAFANNASTMYPNVYKAYTYSAYVSDVLNLTDRLSVLAALRFDYFDNKGNLDPNSNKVIDGSKFNQKTLSPKFGAVYQVVKDQVALFANYQNGFTNVTGVDSTGHTFKPEQANQFEGGVKVDALNGKISATLSYYDIQVKDMVRSDPAHPMFSIQNGTQRSKGFEAAVTANPLPGLNVIAGYAYNDSKMIRSSDIFDGRRPETAGSPNLANLWISYRFNGSSALKGLGLGFGGNYADANKIVNSKVIVQEDGSIKGQGVFYLPSYTVLNASISYDKAKYRFALKMNNITNKEYYTGYSTINPQMLRQVIGSVSLRF